MNNHSCISSNFRPKSKCFQFCVTCLGKSLLSIANCMIGLSHHCSAISGNNNFICDCEERLYLKVNMVIGHEMMYIPPKLSCRS